MTNRLVEIITEPNVVEVGPPRVVSCRIVGDPDQVLDVLQEDDAPTKHVTGTVLNSLVEKCQRHLLTNLVNQRTGNNETGGEDEQDGDGSLLEGLVIYPGRECFV